MPPQTFTCTRCGADHEATPVLGTEAPAPYLALTDTQRQARAELTSDQCVIDGTAFFVRGVLELPAHGGADPLTYSTWVRVEKADFLRLSEHWTREGREAEPPVRGTLAASLPGYPETRLLRVALHTRPVGQSFLVRVEAPNHPLTRDQQEGLPRERLQHLVEEGLHPAGAWPPPLAERVLEELHRTLGAPDALRTYDARRARGGTPPLPRTDVAIWRAGPERRVSVFATLGMSAQRMPGPAPLRAELHFAVRAPVSEADESRVGAFLANLSNYPWQVGQPVDWWQTLAPAEPVPLFPGCSAVLLHPAFTDGAFEEARAGEERLHLLHVVPLTKAEHQLAREDLEALLRQWEAARLDVFRPR